MLQRPFVSVTAPFVQRLQRQIRHDNPRLPHQFQWRKPRESRVKSRSQPLVDLPEHTFSPRLPAPENGECFLPSALLFATATPTLNCNHLPARCNVWCNRCSFNIRDPERCTFFVTVFQNKAWCRYVSLLSNTHIDHLIHGCNQGFSRVQDSLPTPLDVPVSSRIALSRPAMHE